MHVDHEEARRAFLDQLAALLEVGAGLSDTDCLAASRCRGWTVGDVPLSEEQAGEAGPVAGLLPVLG